MSDRPLLPSAVVPFVLSTAIVAAPVPQLKPDDREVHVVCVYEGATADGAPRGFRQHPQGHVAVRIDRPGKTVTVVLSSYEPVAWDVSFTPQTRLSKVILGGYYKQVVSESPRGVELVELFHDGRGGQPYFYGPYRIDADEFRPLVRQIHDLTGLDIASYQGIYRADPARPFVIDRPQSDPRLRSDYPRPSPPAELPKVEFRALHCVPGNRPALHVAYGDFTLTGGPKLNTLRPLPAGIQHLAVEPTTKVAYGLSGQEVCVLDLATRQVIKLDLGPNVPRLSWPSGIAFDTKRQRLLVATSGGGGLLYAYTPKDGQWSVLADLGGTGPHALAYHPAEDAIFGLRGDYGGDGVSVPVLLRYNENGALVSRTKLGEPMFPGLIRHHPHSSHVQLVAAGDDLVVLASAGLHPGRQQNPETFMYFVEPKTGKTRLTWRQP